MIHASCVADHGVAISECRLDDDTDVTIAEAWVLLDDGERDRAARFVFDRDRDRFVRAHGFLRIGLGAALGLPARDVPIVTREWEKPFVAGNAVRFSLSHSGSCAVLAIAQGNDVGIDVETADASSRIGSELGDLAQACLTDAERAALDALPEERRLHRFLSYWTAKEARMKLTGEGLALDPKSIALGLQGGRAIGIVRPVKPECDLHFVKLARRDVICCLAVGSDV